MRELGRGGMGVVYEAHDRVRDVRVALKLLREASATTLYRFKREFRALAGVAHHNLVALHELVNHDDQWFFTMELLEGVDFLSYVRANPQQLRRALGELVDAVSALHDAGVLHRDLKPSNVLVAPSGRTVVLDFGLVADLSGAVPESREFIVGTAAYIAPEQATGAELDAASDWYSVGVMLYEALTGRPPFRGALMDVLARKETEEPPPPSAVADGVPADLDELCAALLRRLPARRPSGAELRARLGATTDDSGPTELPFVGRAGQLAELDRALQSTLDGHPMTAYVRGLSGMGKSALVRRFLDRATSRYGAVVLEGRCYERETVPYEALDSLVDALSRHLKSLDPAVAAAALPVHVHALARVFPVLRRVEAVAAAPLPEDDTRDPQEQRRRAFAALRELLARLADLQPLVLSIDDLQWGGIDSAGALMELTRPPDPPALLLIAAFRDDDAERSPLLRALLGRRAGGSATTCDLHVGPLEPDDAAQLARAILGATATEAVVRAIVDEAGGSPFFLRELALARRGGAGASLHTVLAARFDALGGDARRLLETIAVAGIPLRLADAERAARVGDDAAAATLQRAHLVRTRSHRGDDLVECSHDRIRETAVSLLDGDGLRDRHRALAVALEGGGETDPELLAAYWHAAGDAERAAGHALEAAATAAAMLAFDRASQLYALALELQPHMPERNAAQIALADALAAAGRGPDAAHAYRVAVPAAPSAERALELQRRAAEQLLRSGHTDDGMRALRDVMRAAGLSFPGSPRAALWSLLRARARLRLRGLRFTERDASAIPADELIRIDTLWAAASGVGFVDVVRGSDFQSRSLLRALRAGEPYRVARALAAEAAFCAAAGASAEPRAQEMVALADELARRIGSQHAIGLVQTARAITAFATGRWSDVVDAVKPAMAIYRNRCVGAQWELASARQMLLWALPYTGAINELRHRVPAALREAEELGDYFTMINLRTGHPSLVWLVPGDVATAREQLGLAVAMLPRGGFYIQHYNALICGAHLDLYEQRPHEARAGVTARWPALERSLLLRMQQFRIEAWFLRARVELAAAAADRDRRGLARAERDARRIRREDAAWGQPLAALIEAGAARARGDAATAERALHAARRDCDHLGLALLGACATWRLGELTGDVALVDEARTWLTTRGVTDPPAWIRLWAPA